MALAPLGWQEQDCHQSSDHCLRYLQRFAFLQIWVAAFYWAKVTHDSKLQPSNTVISPKTQVLSGQRLYPGLCWVKQKVSGRRKCEWRHDISFQNEAPWTFLLRKHGEQSKARSNQKPRKKIKLHFGFKMKVFLRSCGKVQFALGQPQIHSGPPPLSWSSSWIKTPASDFVQFLVKVLPLVPFKSTCSHAKNT